MAFHCIKLIRMAKWAQITPMVRRNLFTLSKLQNDTKIHQMKKDYRTEDNFVYLEDPDTFGTLAGKPNIENDTFKDEGDVVEHEFLQNVPLRSQKLTIKQYADLIKQYIKHKRLKEAFDVLEVRMLKEDRVKPENYIYNILIGACADVGYTKKAFKLYNEMKKRGLKPTGDSYTCLFTACVNSPWPTDGLQLAQKIRSLMIEKGIEPNVTNYNSMIKAFGWCGDLPTAFKIVDEMVSKKIKIRVHTFNHLLHACITDKGSGLRHALIVWRKMLRMREKPNIYSFNLMLKCVKECNLGSKEDIEELISIIEGHMALQHERLQVQAKQLQIESSKTEISKGHDKQLSLMQSESNVCHNNMSKINECRDKEIDRKVLNTDLETNNELAIYDDRETITFELIDKLEVPKPKREERTVPNLLSKILIMDKVLALKEVNTLQDKFAIVGGQNDFLKEMETYSVKPDIKTFTQMVPLVGNDRESENKLIETMKSADIKADIDFYNMLIKRRCLRADYEGAFEVKEMIEKESKHRRKKYPLKKKLRLKANIMTYGVLAMACKTKDCAEKLLNEMKEEQIKVNIQILGALMRQATVNKNFAYVYFVMNVVKQENIEVNPAFVKHLETFNDKCSEMVQQDENGQRKCTEGFAKAYGKFSEFYNNWLKEMNVEEALKPEHPWAQFQQSYPETFQRSNIVIKEPRKFYKRNRKYVRYTPRI